ncbi:MAG: PAS domain-containing protein [Caulobacteraceae bacterium]|nr:MAG: PAS domain-containing protein [Caulobacteraceae bacterium]
MMNPLQGIAEAQTLAQAIVNTIHEPLLVLDGDLRVMAASRAFYETFKVDPDDTFGALLYDLGDGQWDIPALRLLLETIIPERAAMDDFEVSHDFPGVGQRTMLLNARKVVYETSPDHTILLAFTDVTTRRTMERDLAELLARTEALLEQKQILLQEMEHRVANSLQIIASILMLKARAVNSPETRDHLKDAHQRVMSVAAVQSHLHAVEGIDQIEVGPYLGKLCESLGRSMIAEDRPIGLQVLADEGRMGSAQAVSLGLIVTELVINAVKYAFPDGREGARVVVRYESLGEDWKLTVSDNGVGKSPAPATGTVQGAVGGLGTVIVQALVKQLDARLEADSDSGGMTVTVTRATFIPRKASGSQLH